MDVFNLNENLLTYGFFANKIKPPQWCATFFVKATLKLEHGGVAVAAEEPAPASGAVHLEDDAAKPMLYDSDFAPMKPKADVLLVGTAHVPGQQSEVKLDVSLRVGSLAKTLTVHGPRKWTGNFFGGRATTPPESFTSMPLSYEHAFGGEGYAKNPVGKSYRGEIAPRIEDPRHPVTGAKDSADPAGFGPIPAGWPQRQQFVGTYKGNYAKERWPWFPEDFNWSFFNAAPPDQQVAFLRGDEAIELENLHPKHPVYKTRLPGLRARAYVEEKDEKGGLTSREVPLKLDTLWINADEEKAILVWRGATDIRNRKLREVTRIAILAEPLTAPARTPVEVFGMIAAQLAAEEAAFDAEFDDPEREKASAEFDKEMEALENEFAEMDQEFAKIEADAEAEFAAPSPAPPDALMAAFLASQTPPPPSPDPTPDELISPQLRAEYPEMAALTDEAATIPDADEASAALDAEIDAADPFPDPPEVTRELIMSTMAAGGVLTGLTMSRLDLSGLKLAKMNFSDSDMSDIKLAGADLKGANFTGVDLTKADLSGADLTGAILIDADLDGAILAGAKLTNLSLKDVVMTKVDLTGADLSGAHGEGAEFSNSNLEKATFVGAKLPLADFSKCKLAGTNFTGAMLADADFDGAQADQANFEKGDLTGFRGSDANFKGANFSGINAPGAIFDGSDLDGANFARARMPEAQLPDTSCRNTSFDRAVLTKASFQGACLEKAILSNANLLYSSFDQADLSGADFRGANLYGAGFWEALLDKATFDRANLKNTVLA